MYNRSRPMSDGSLAGDGKHKANGPTSTNSAIPRDSSYSPCLECSCTYTGLEATPLQYVWSLCMKSKLRAGRIVECALPEENNS